MDISIKNTNTTTEFSNINPGDLFVDPSDNQIWMKIHKTGRWNSVRLSDGVAGYTALFESCVLIYLPKIEIDLQKLVVTIEE